MNAITAEIICYNTSSWFRSRLSITSRLCNRIALKVSAELNPSFATYLAGCVLCNKPRTQQIRDEIRESAPHSDVCKCIATSDYEISFFGQGECCDNVVICERMRQLKHVCYKATHFDNLDAVINDYHLMVRMKYYKLLRYRQRISDDRVLYLWSRLDYYSLNCAIPRAAYTGNITKIHRSLRNTSPSDKHKALLNACQQGHVDIAVIILTHVGAWYWKILQIVKDTTGVFDRVNMYYNGKLILITDNLASDANIQSKCVEIYAKPIG